MKVFFVGFFLFFIVISFGIKLIAIMSYSSFDAWMKNRSTLLSSRSELERVLAIIFYWYIDGRWVIGGVGVFGLVFSLIFF